MPSTKKKETYSQAMNRLEKIVSLVTFTEREQRLLDVLKEKEKLSLNQCCKLCRLNHKTTCELLADFIRFGLVELVFHGHKFYFKLNKE